MPKHPPLRLPCALGAEPPCDAVLYLQWPVPRAGWSPEDFQEALGDTGWTIYEVAAEEGGEACCVLACPECSSVVGEGFGTTNPPELVDPEL